MMDRSLNLNNEKLSSALTRVALPIAGQSLLGSCLNLVDNLMVGNLGEISLASVGLGSQIFFVYWMIVFGFVSGTATYMAQFYGKNDFANIKHVLGIAVSVTSVAGLIFFLACLLAPGQILSIFTNIDQVKEIGLDYIRMGSPCYLFIALSVPLSASLRATQQIKIPLIASVTAFATNTFLNYLLIYGNFGAPRLEVSGAALATVIARFVELTIMLIVVFGMKNKLAGKIRDYFSWKKELFTKVIKNSVPTTINETAWGAGVAMYNAAYGRIGVTAFAAIQASGTIQNIFIMACFSLGDAMLILVGERLGRGELERGYSMAKGILKAGVIIGIISGILLAVSSRFIVKLFDFTPTGLSYASIIIIIYSVMLFVKVYNSAIITGALRAGGDTRFAMFAETGCVWLIGVPLAFIGALVLKLPVYYVVLLVQTEEFVKFFITTYRFRSRKWVKNLVKHL